MLPQHFPSAPDSFVNPRRPLCTVFIEVETGDKVGASFAPTSVSDSGGFTRRTTLQVSGSFV